MVGRVGGGGCFNGYQCVCGGTPHPTLPTARAGEGVRQSASLTLCLGELGRAFPPTGRMRSQMPTGPHPLQHAECDLLVIGSGAGGLSAAVTAVGTASR